MKIEKTWITKAGYQATVKIMPQGHRCGYVTLPDGHPCVGKGYNDLAIQVHCGLTYGDGATFGFDCAHYCDKPDRDQVKYLLIAIFLCAAGLAYYDTFYLLPERQGEVKCN